MGSVGRSWSATLRHWLLGGLGVVLGEGGGDEGGDHPPAVLAGMGQGVAHEVHPAALPGGVQHLGDGGLDALMGIGDRPA